MRRSNHYSRNNLKGRQGTWFGQHQPCKAPPVHILGRPRRDTWGSIASPTRNWPRLRLKQPQRVSEHLEVTTQHHLGTYHFGVLEGLTGIINDRVYNCLLHRKYRERMATATVTIIMQGSIQICHTNGFKLLASKEKMGKPVYLHNESLQLAAKFTFCKLRIMFISLVIKMEQSCPPSY